MPVKTVKLSAAEIVDEVRSVLLNAARGKGTAPNYLTAYQILNRLEAARQDRLVREYGIGGRGHGSRSAATVVVKNALKRLGKEIDVVFLDTKDVELRVRGKIVFAGNRVCALYRIVRA
jgi:hypothetical protein